VTTKATHDTVRKAQFAVVPMWVHRRIITTRTRTMALAVYVELVGQYAGSERDADGLRVWPEVQQIADGMGVPKRNIVRALDVLIDCGVVLKKRTMRRNQYWLPQEDPEAFTKTLADFQGPVPDAPQSAASDTLDKIQSATSGTLRSATSGTLYNPDPFNPDPNNPSSSSGACVTERPTVAEAVTEEEEEHQDDKHDDTTPPAPVAGEHQDAAAGIVSGLPRVETFGRTITEQLQRGVAAALAEGWTPAALTRFLTAEYGPGIRQPGAYFLSRLKKLPAPSAPVVPKQAAREGMCPVHPYYPAGDCSHCDRTATKGTLPPSAVALLARMRAGAS
jgi:hypothetical protein